MPLRRGLLPQGKEHTCSPKPTLGSCSQKSRQTCLHGTLWPDHVIWGTSCENRGVPSRQLVKHFAPHF